LSADQGVRHTFFTGWIAPLDEAIDAQSVATIGSRTVARAERIHHGRNSKALAIEVNFDSETLPCGLRQSRFRTAVRAQI